MRYINKIKKKHVREYLQMLAQYRYPDFIDEYLETAILKRLDGIELFCGMGYTSIPILQMKDFFSRLDHSIACAIITWNLTGDKTQTLAALFHDTGTPAFSHAVDFKMGDGITQTSSELEIIDVIKNDSDVLRLLKRDNIKIEDVADYKKYPIIDKKIPALCVDRLEGVFSTGYFWGQFWSLKEINDIYDCVCVLESTYDRWTLPASDRALEFGIEVGISDYGDPEAFYEGVIKYSILLQTKEDKFSMYALGQILRVYEDANIISPNDFYKLSEEAIINKMLSSNLANLWLEFTNMSTVKNITKLEKEVFAHKVEAKLRTCSPLIATCYGPDVLLDVSSDALDNLEEFLKYYYENGNLILATDDFTNDTKEKLKALQ